MDSNVWKENRIAPLEYCSFERAAKLLNCECEDLIHWNKIGAISLAFEPKNLAGDLSVSFYENVADNIERYNLSYNITADLSFYGSIFNSKRGYKEGVYFHQLRYGFNFSGYINGLWIISSGVINENSGIFISNEKSNGCCLFQPINKSNEICSTFFIYKGDEEFTLGLSELFITRLDIEKIWAATILGEPMDSYFTGKPREDKPILPNPVSLTQSARHDRNRQRLESAAKNVLTNHRDECVDKSGKLVFTKWASATLKYRNNYGGFIHSSQRGISKILKEMQEEETAQHSAG
ncbi:MULTISPECIES: hypothetical protein [Citrobacter freundii complex]|nr:hypothetical protein [Citrobacter freundii]